MPAKNTRRIDKEKAYYHVYNRGVARRTLFNDEEDYQTFLNYLRDYLISPDELEATKKTFTIKGQTFEGVPHQPKNYFGKVELIAYSLAPNCFHLLLRQKTKGSLQKFMRSLGTRYSMYFNKKYQRTGTLFGGPYKSILVDDPPGLLYLTRYFHRYSEQDSQDPSVSYSSYPDYLGSRETSWIKPEVVLSFFEKSENDSFKGAHGYKNFVEEYQLDEKEEKLLEKITLEDKPEPLERNRPQFSGADLSQKPVPEMTPSSPSRVPEFAMATAIFVVLFTIGFRNVWVSSAQIESPVPTPAVSGVEDVKEPEEVEPKIMLQVKIGDESATVNIRQRPTTGSEKIGEAKDGEVLEFIAINSGWYEVKLADGSTGFISARYLEIIENSPKETNE